MVVGGCAVEYLVTVFCESHGVRFIDDSANLIHTHHLCKYCRGTAANIESGWLP